MPSSRPGSCSLCLWGWSAHCAQLITAHQWILVLRPHHWAWVIFWHRRWWHTDDSRVKTGESQKQWWILVPMDPGTNGGSKYQWIQVPMDPGQSDILTRWLFKTGGCSEQLIGEYNFWSVYSCCCWSVSVLSIDMEILIASVIFSVSGMRCNAVSQPVHQCQLIG